MQASFQDNHILLQALRHGEEKAFEYLYRQYYASVANMVRQHQGTEEDAREVFQETMIALFKKLRDDRQFNLTASWHTLIYAIARNQWLKRYQKRQQRHERPLEASFLAETADDSAETAEQEQELEQKHIAVQQAFKAMNPDCRELLDAAFFKKLSGTEIAALLGYSESFVKVKKHRCLEALRKQVNASGL
jgi:RNA polymerase sigma factor (sigma-70 family)